VRWPTGGPTSCWPAVTSEGPCRAADELESDLDRSSIELLTLDLADLVSVRRAAEQFLAEHARLDLLINNAGVMGTPYRQTADGFELQMATNHLGHFAFTGSCSTGSSPPTGPGW
jgi:NAD(P)-dependent dehydrogenase (short-subunit alcohol dehydrogenase family)